MNARTSMHHQHIPYDPKKVREHIAVLARELIRAKNFARLYAIGEAKKVPSGIFERIITPGNLLKEEIVAEEKRITDILLQHDPHIRAIISLMHYDTHTALRFTEHVRKTLNTSYLTDTEIHRDLEKFVRMHPVSKTRLDDT